MKRKIVVFVACWCWNLLWIVAFFAGFWRWFYSYAPLVERKPEAIGVWLVVHVRINYVLANVWRKPAPFTEPEHTNWEVDQ